MPCTAWIVLAQVDAIAAVAQDSRVRAVYDVGPAGCAIFVASESPFCRQPFELIFTGVY